jgi:hypothetical protein
MAAGQHNPSRRALLGAAVGLPLVGGINSEFARPPAFAFGYGGSPSPSELGEDWVKALAAFEKAEAAVREIEAATAGYSLEDEEALLPAHGAACAAMEAALGRLLLVPAPDLPAFSAKLELLLEHALEPHSVGEDVLAAVRGDVRRLAGMA